MLCFDALLLFPFSFGFNLSPGALLQVMQGKVKFSNLDVKRTRADLVPQEAAQSEEEGEDDKDGEEANGAQERY